MSRASRGSRYESLLLAMIARLERRHASGVTDALDGESEVRAIESTRRTERPCTGIADGLKRPVQSLDSCIAESRWSRRYWS